MGRYCTASDCIQRYSRLDTVADSGSQVSYLESAHIYFAEFELDSRLAPKFTTPFSSNNLTAKDLAIDITYCRAGNLKMEERDKLCSMVNSRIAALLMGDENMLTTSGSSLVSVGGTVWSSTEDYHPVFGMGEIEEFHVDSSQVYAEELARDGG